MKVLITGADGYIGRALARHLAAPGATLQGRAIDQLTLCDLRLPEAPQAPQVRAVAGSIADAAVIDAVTRNRPDVVFHLASVPSGQSESDYELGLKVNVHATLALVEAVRRGGAAPTFVFTSSIAVFGAPLPARIDDDTPLRPALSYGAQKQMAEILLADCTRRGFLHARSLRLPGIVARPPTPTGALSAFSSELIRALVEQRPYVCPVSASATLWLLSLQACIDNLVHAAQCPAERLGGHTVWTLPALRLSIGELVQAFEAERPGASALVSYRPDEALEAQFGRLPPLTTVRADAAGFRHDGSVAELIRRAARSLEPSPA
jgi:D-erythronate 2-dehydrogenase